MARGGALLIVMTVMASCLVGAEAPAHAVPRPEPARVDPTMGSGEVRGVVTGAENGLGLRRVRMVLRQNESSKIVKVKHTDKGGSFSFDDLPAGVYSLEAQAAGYYRKLVAPIVIRAGKARLEHITLTPQGEEKGRSET